MSASQLLHEVALKLIGPVRFALVMSDGFAQAWSKLHFWERRGFRKWAKDAEVVEKARAILSAAICEAVPQALNNGKMERIYADLADAYCLHLLKAYRDRRQS